VDAITKQIADLLQSAVDADAKNVLPRDKALAATAN
jgi:hypothetical protein